MTDEEDAEELIEAVEDAADCIERLEDADGRTGCVTVASLLEGGSWEACAGEDWDSAGECVCEGWDSCDSREGRDCSCEGGLFTGGVLSSSFEDHRVIVSSSSVYRECFPLTRGFLIMIEPSSWHSSRYAG